MNGYKLQADNYRKLLDRDGVDKDIISAKIRIYDILAGFSGDDRYIAFDSGMFNDIVAAYIERSLDNIAQSGNKDYENAIQLIKDDVISELYTLLDRTGSENI